MQMQQLNPMRVFTVAFALALLAAAAPGEEKRSPGEVAQPPSRQDVSKLCQGAGGIEYGTQTWPPGQTNYSPYGCVTDNFWIDCNWSGDNCAWGGADDGWIEGEGEKDQTKEKVQTATQRWTQVSRLEPKAAAGASATPCTSCEKTLVQMQQLDGKSRALMNEAQTLRRQADRGSVSTKQQAQRIHRRLNAIARQLDTNTVQRKTLLEQHEAQLIEATAAARVDKTRGTWKQPAEGQPAAPPVQTAPPAPRVAPRPTAPPRQVAGREELPEGVVQFGNSIRVKDGYKLERLSKTQVRMLKRTRAGAFQPVWANDCTCPGSGDCISDSSGIFCAKDTSSPCDCECPRPTVFQQPVAQTEQPGTAGQVRQVQTAPQPGTVQEPASGQPSDPRSRFRTPGVGEQRKVTQTVRILAAEMDVKCKDKKGNIHKYTISTGTGGGGCQMTLVGPAGKGGQGTEVQKASCSDGGNKASVNCEISDGEGGCNPSAGSGDCDAH